MRKAGLIVILVFFCVSANAVKRDTTYFKYRYRAYKKERRDPGISFISSWMVPGTGQFYNKEFKKGTLCLIADVLIYGLIAYTGNEPRLDYRGIDKHPYNILGAVSLFGLMLVASNDAHSSSNRLNKKLRQKYGVYKDAYDSL